MTLNCTENVIDAGLEQAVKVRFYRPSQASRAAPVVLHLHGGAFVGGAPEQDALVPRLLAEAGAAVASIDYPLAPAHPFPEALQTCFAALKWLHRQKPGVAGKKSPLLVAGEEAGGNLAAALALMARDQQSPPLAGQILISPMLDPCLATRSIREAEAGAVGCKWADGWHQYLRSAEKAAHPYAAPLQSSRLAGLPPALVLTAEDDPMRDESLSYARRLRDLGIAVQSDVLPAPTGWPDALGNGAHGGDWTRAMRDRFVHFFESLQALSLRPIQA